MIMRFKKVFLSFLFASLIYVLFFHGDHSYGMDNITPCTTPNIGELYSRQDKVRDVFHNYLDVVFYGTIVERNTELYNTFKRQGNEVKVFRDRITYKVESGLKGVENQSYVDVWDRFRNNQSTPQDDVLVKARYNGKGDLDLVYRVLTGNCLEMNKPITNKELLKVYHEERILFFTFLAFCFLLVGSVTYAVFVVLKKRKERG